MKLRDALKKWESRTGDKASESEEIKLIFTNPPIEKLDSQSMQKLKKCKKLSISTNNIEKIGKMNGLKIETLSLGRNNIKVINNLEPLSDTLENLWLSYNKICKLTGVQSLKKLKTLYLIDNLIESWEEIEKLRDLENLTKSIKDESEYRKMVIKRIPNLKILDGKPVLSIERVKQKEFFD